MISSSYQSPPENFGRRSNTKNPDSSASNCLPKFSVTPASQLDHSRFVGELHNIIEARGKRAALEADLDRCVVDVAVAYMSDEDTGIGFLYAGWCQAALPHKKLPDEEGWQIKASASLLLSNLECA